MKKGHKERAHSKFSASGSERWLHCAASVALEESSPPSPDNAWAAEGTLAHEILELRLKGQNLPTDNFDVTDEMVGFVQMAARKIEIIEFESQGNLTVEGRIYQSAIHPEMFGTCDAVVVQDFGTLHIIDFKYGQGHIVDPVENTQLIQYALGYAEKFNWNFYDVELHIMQPRSGKNWHKSWKITCRELHDKWLPIWVKGVERVERNDAPPFEGAWCHWCRAKTICPAKQEKNANKISEIFKQTPIERKNNGKKEESKKEDCEEKGGKEGREKSKTARPTNRFKNASDENRKRRAAESFGRRGTF